MLDYSWLFVIHFCWVGGSVCQGLAGLCSWEWKREFHVVRGAHLFVLSIDAQAVLEQQQQEMVPHFLIITWHEEAFHGLRGTRCQKFDSGWCFISA
jgi:hypothetical protein